jgi:hypothetical protein
MNMIKSFAATIFTATLLAGAAGAQTMAPGSENPAAAQPGTAPQNSMMPVTPKPATQAAHPHRHHHASSTNATNQSSSNTSTPPSATPNPAATPSRPDQGKPGIRSQDDATTMHTPGSENPQDQGPTGAPKA